jgi:hypothetical protein
MLIGLRQGVRQADEFVVRPSAISVRDTVLEVSVPIDDQW